MFNILMEEYINLIYHVSGKCNTRIFCTAFLGIQIGPKAMQAELCSAGFDGFN